MMIDYSILAKMIKAKEFSGGDKVRFDCFASSDILQCYKDDNGGRYAFAYYSEHLDARDWWEIQEDWIDGWRRYLNKGVRIQKVCQYDVSVASKQYPYRVYLVGCDDSSYTRCFSSREEAWAVMTILSGTEIIHNARLIKDLGFIFTN